MRAAVMLAVAGLILFGCGADEDPGSDQPQASDQATILTITVVSDEGAEPRVMELICDPPGGDHPNPVAACAKLAEVGGAAAFAPTSRDQACTMIYGGPQTATITGKYERADIDASFSRDNGCELDRWDALGTEVFDVPLQ